MCGIVGYIGEKKATSILINGLQKLEYRGYDSAGIATIEENKICVKKDVGRVDNLKKIEGIDQLNGTVGIAHTRWATHGKPSTENSHPHMDNDEFFAVVHNGIIENYLELKDELLELGYKFLSQTDTEIIPNLINYYYKQDKVNDENTILRAVKNTCKRLKGSYALEVIIKDDSNRIIVTRKDSPLVIGIGDGENYVASDIPAILPYTKKFYFLDDLDIVDLRKDKIEFYDNNLNKKQKEIKEINWDATAAEKDGYEDFMLKEIHEQPKAIKETIGNKLNGEKIEFTDFSISKELLSGFNKIYIVACGTAMHAGMVAKTSFEKLCKINTEVDIASEFRYRDPLIDDKTLAIYISQSGETADTIAALKLAKAKGATTIAVSNVVGSSITREADYTIYTHAGPEIAVASTKAYTSQVALLIILSMYFAEILNSCEVEKIKELKQEILKLPEKIEEELNDTSKIERFAQKVCKEKDMFFLGRGTDYAVSLEGSLKLKEISYIHSESYASGELKHGPIALIENGVTVIATITDSKLKEKSLSNIQEVITRGAKVLIITNQKIENKGFEEILRIPFTNCLLSPILSVIPLQLLAYHISKMKGLDVDKPRNLAKSVTVE